MKFVNGKIGMAKPQVLLTIISLGIMLGTFIFYFLEPYLLVPEKKEEIKKSKIANPISKDELEKNVNFIKSELLSLRSDMEDTYNLIINSKKEKILY